MNETAKAPNKLVKTKIKYVRTNRKDTFYISLEKEAQQNIEKVKEVLEQTVGIKFNTRQTITYLINFFLNQQ